MFYTTLKQYVADVLRIEVISMHELEPEYEDEDGDVHEADQEIINDFFSAVDNGEATNYYTPDGMFMSWQRYGELYVSAEDSGLVYYVRWQKLLATNLNLKYL